MHSKHLHSSVLSQMSHMTAVPCTVGVHALTVLLGCRSKLSSFRFTCLLAVYFKKIIVVPTQPMAITSKKHTKQHTSDI